MASLNVNGARDIGKRFKLYEIIKQKKIDVLLVQETHSDILNSSDWAKEFDGLSVLSHLTSTSGGVAILFSKNFIPCSYQVEEVIKGRLLKVVAQFENCSFIFICVYVPVNTLERMLFLDTLSKVLCNCNPENSLLLGGDFNCTETESILDRNHVEPHMPSQKRLIQLLKTHEIVDVWRNFHGIQKQYTWAHAYDNLISLARLDRFYCFKHQLNLFRSCSICPVGLSDHSLLQCAVSQSFIKPKSAYWHFNSNLLCDKHFKDIFKEFWKFFRTTKSSFQCLQQWWDVAKVQIKQLCQQYTLNVTRDITRSMKTIEKELVELHTRVDNTCNLAQFDSFNKKKNILGKLLDTVAQGALVRSRFQSIEMMDAPSKFFFNLEKKNGQRRFIYALRSESGSLLSDSHGIRKRAVRFYEELYKSELLHEKADNVLRICLSYLKRLMVSSAKL